MMCKKSPLLLTHQQSPRDLRLIHNRTHYLCVWCAVVSGPIEMYATESPTVGDVVYEQDARGSHGSGGT